MSAAHKGPVQSAVRFFHNLKNGELWKVSEGTPEHHVVAMCVSYMSSAKHPILRKLCGEVSKIIVEDVNHPLHNGFIQAFMGNTNLRDSNYIYETYTGHDLPLRLFPDQEWNEWMEHVVMPLKRDYEKKRILKSAMKKPHLQAAATTPKKKELF